MELKKYTVDFPLEYCAARFLRQWENDESSLCNRISKNPNNEDILNALAYFMVSRNFRGISEEPRLQRYVRENLESVKNNHRLARPLDKVTTLATLFKKEWHQYNLSAASKLLWLSYKAPYIIYDKRAVNALTRKASHKRIKNNYEKYMYAWRTEYKSLSGDITAAIENLPNGRLFMPRTSYPDTKLKSFSRSTWFKERVFDIFLWELGGAD